MGIKSTPPDLARREYRQALIRLGTGIALLASFALWAFWRPAAAPASINVAVAAVALFILVPLALLISIRRYPEQFPGRNYTSLVLDVTCVTAALYFGNELFAPFCLAYSWIIFDYTKRFGRRFLYPTAGASILSFSALLVLSDFWLANTGSGLIFLTFIALLPFYIKSFGPDDRTSITLPKIERGQLQNPETANMDDTQHDNQQKDPGNLSSRKILLVSGDTEDRHGIQRQLDLWGTRPALSSNAAHAFYDLIAAWKQGDPYHAVIVDNGRLGMDAAQFANAVRSEPVLQSLYLIHVGPGHHGLHRDRLLSAGFTRLLSTPLNKTFLFNALHNTATQPESGGQVVRLIDRYSSEMSDQPLSILVADRSFSVRQRVRSILQRAGHRVFMVNNGARVLDALDSHRFDLAMVSLDLREITGLEAFKLYRFTRVDKQCVPFILLLDEPTRELLKRCSDAGINATINQNADARQYLETVARVVRENSDEPDFDFSAGSLRPAAHAGSASKEGGVLDIDRLMEIERLGGGIRFLSDLIDSFNRDNRRILTQMKEVATNSDASRFRDLGHAIKDAAGSLGTLKLYRLGSAASRLSDKDFHESAATLVQEITECCRISNDALHSYLLGQNHPESDSLRD